MHFDGQTACLILVQLAHPPLDKMAAISQTIYSDAFPWMKSLLFWLKFHRSLSLYTEGPGDNVCSDNGLVPKRRRTIIWSSADPIQRRIYAALWGDELTLIVVHTRDNRYLKLWLALSRRSCLDFPVHLSYGGLWEHGHVHKTIFWNTFRE